MPRPGRHSRLHRSGRTRVSLRLLGGFEVRLVPGGTIQLPQRKSQALLAYLAVGPTNTQLRDTLAALLWADAPRDHARNSLRQALFVLRRALTHTAPKLIRTDGDVVILDRGAMDVDVVVFERLARTRGPGALERAATLYRGELLAGFGVDEPSFEDWLAPRREELRGLALSVFQQLLGRRLKQGSAWPVLETATRLLTLDPLHESAHHAVMRLHAEQGNTAAALRQYDNYRRILRRELGREPGAETRDLYSAIRHRNTSAGAAPRTELPLIGRSVESDAILRRLDAAEARQTQAVVVTGEAGIGKTRLVEEVVAEAIRRRGHVAIGRCYETQQILPFGPWLDAARTGGLLAGGVIEALAPTWRRELARLLPEVDPERGRAPASPNHPRLFEAFAHLVEQVATTRPLLLVLEDGHWADELSLRLLAFLARRLPATRLLLVLTVREEEAGDAPVLGQVLAELEREGRLTRVRLAPLSRADVTALVHALVEDPTAVAGLAEEAWSASDGNPFFTVETVRARTEDGLSDVAGLRRLPERLQLLVSRRLDHLSARGRHLAIVTAVVRKEAPLRLLALAAGMSDADAEDEAAELVQRRILVERPSGLDMAHERVREAALAVLPGARARLLHRRVAESLEAFHAAHLDDHLAAIASHYFAGEAWERAAAFFRQAGDRALAHGAYREATACFEGALAALRALPEDRAIQEQCVDLLFSLRHALLPLGETDRIREVVGRAAVLAEHLGDRRRQAHGALLRSSYHWWVGEHAQAYELAASGLRSGRELGDETLGASATYFMAIAHEARGSYREAVRLLRPLSASPRSGISSAYGGPTAPAVFWTSHLARSLAELGDFDAARTVADDAMRLMAPLHHPFLTLHASCSVATVALRQGRPDEVIPLLERLRDVNMAGNALVAFPVNEWFLAYAYALAGRPEAADLLRRMEQLTDDAGFPYYYPFWLTLLGEGYLLLGEVENALSRSTRALELSRARGERGCEGWSLRLSGDALSALRPRSEGEIASHYRSALAIAEELGMEPLRAHCYLGLGDLEKRARRPAAAERHHGVARRLLEAMGMTRWLDRPQV